MLKRLKPEQIQAGRSYRLMPRYSYIPGMRLICRVEAIHDGYVIVKVNGKEVRMSVCDFAALAVEEMVTILPHQGLEEGSHENSECTFDLRR